MKLHKKLFYGFHHNPEKNKRKNRLDSKKTPLLLIMSYSFSVNRPFRSFVKFIPQYFILFVATEKGVPFFCHFFYWNFIVGI